MRFPNIKMNRFANMGRNHWHPSRTKRGFVSLIGLLIVLVIIFYLVEEGYFKKNPATGKTQADTYIDRGKEAACSVNRRAIEAQIAESSSVGGGQLPSANILRAKLGSTYHCPGKGKYQIDTQGNVYCTEHDPAPESAEGSVIALQE
jgi:hypothetical protein